MNFVNYIHSRGICRTAAGHTILNLRVDNQIEEYPISGIIQWSTGFQSRLRWNKEGYPINPQLNHGLKLLPVIPKVIYDPIR